MKASPPKDTQKRPLPTSATPLHRPWYFVGLPGSGKSKVGRLLAALFDVPHLDIDQVIEEQTGRKITNIFDEDGEETFRELERDAILASGGEAGVISLGGGAVLSKQVRDFLGSQTVIWVDASDQELVRRVKRRSTRPLLRENPGWVIGRLRQEREDYYEAVASVRVRSTSEPVECAVHKVLQAVLGWEVVPVEAARDYFVYVGAGATDLLAGALPAASTKVFLVLPETMADKSGAVLKQLQRSGKEIITFTHPEGEAAKDLGVVARAWDLMGENHVGRKDVVVTFGGGATTDLGGFLAATWARGIQVVHLPTSLLGMVDASVGSKTGINTKAGKNLVGAFHDPRAVIIDLDHLKTLPEEEFIAGLAEVVKAGFIGAPDLLTLVEENPEISSVSWATGEGADTLLDAVVSSVRLKAEVVTEDRLEGGVREHLNYGHTLAHAIEKTEKFGIRHGEAVAIGAVFAAHLANSLGRVDEGETRRHERLFKAAGLPTHYNGDPKTLIDAMRADKKARAGAIRFALLGEDGMEVVSVGEGDILKAIASFEPEEEAK